MLSGHVFHASNTCAAPPARCANLARTGTETEQLCASRATSRRSPMEQFLGRVSSSLAQLRAARYELEVRPSGVVEQMRRLAMAMAVTLAIGGCRASGAERSREIVTEVEALQPARVGLAAPELNGDSVVEPPSVCPDVQEQARELGATLPQQLDADTRATGVTARGCDLTLEYELVTLSAREVSESGMRAMRGEVTARLCSDKGALGVMHRGGRFTNVYYDRARAPIGLFTVAADDCGI